MIPNEIPQSIQTSGASVSEVGQFHITANTQARILMSLSDKMYTLKELAVIREYSNNANDAHIVVGKSTSEVIITLPTLTDLNFRVRDFGTGLTKDQIRDVYCILGESTKRNSAEQNGVLGYGCKAGFAHADSFTVTSWINGEKAIYNCIKGDSTHLHSVLELSRAVSDEPAGLEVCVPVNITSVWTFHREAANFFKYWETLPTIVNMEEDSLNMLNLFRNTTPTLKGIGWDVRLKSNSTAVGIAFMGGVSYRIDWNVIGSRMALDSKKRVLFDILKQNDVTIYFKMGEVQFVDSREGLEYTNETLTAVTSRIEDIFSKIKESIQAKFDTAASLWDAKIIYNGFFGTGILEVEKGEDKTCIDKIKILDGNLSALENTFNGIFTWNQIPLTSSDFPHLNRVDNSYDTLQGLAHSPISPVLTTYRRKKLRAKLARCTDAINNKIVASNQVAVVLNDTGNISVKSLLARYLMFCDGTYRTVHMLTFDQSALQELFYNEYNFYTVPVIKASEILPDALNWQKQRRAPSSSSNNGRVALPGGRRLKYINVETGAIERSNIPLRKLNAGGIFLVESCRTCNYVRQIEYSNSFSTGSPYDVANNLKKLANKTGINIDRVYLVSEATASTNWFLEARDSGVWMNLWKYLMDNLNLDIQFLVDAYRHDETNTIGEYSVKAIVSRITEPSSKMLKFIKLMSNTQYENALETVKILKDLELWSEISGGISSSINFYQAFMDIKATYPFLDMDTIDLTSTPTAEVIDNIVKYINAMDLYIEFTTNNTPKLNPQPELIES